MELEHVKGSERQAPHHQELDVNPIGNHTHHFMKIMKIKVLDEEGIQGMTLVTSRLRHSSLMATSN